MGISCYPQVRLKSGKDHEEAEITLQSCEVKEGSKLCNLKIIFFPNTNDLGFKALHLFLLYLLEEKDTEVMKNFRY